MEIEIRDNEITRQVLEYHYMEEGPEKENERRRLERMTEELIYIAPVRSGYISERDACGFYLEERRNAGKLLEAYRISKLSYPDYIGQVMRVRVRNYLIHRKEEESDIKRLHYAERVHQDSITVMDMEEIYASDDRDRKSLPAESIRSAKTLKEAVGRIMSSTGRIMYEESELRKKQVRHGLLCILLTLPKGEGYEYIGHYSELLHVREENIAAILRLRDEKDETREERLEKHREVIGKHFKILLRLNTAYKLCDDEREKEEITEVGDKLEALIEKRCERLRKENAGFTQREIGVILGLSRSSVCVNIRKAKKYLASRIS